MILFTLIGSSATGLAQGKLALQDFLRSGPEERLVDQDGNRITSDRMADRVVAVTFFSTDCSILCVGRLRDLAATVSGLPAAERSHVGVLALTVDPTRDAPDALKAFSDGMKLDPAAVTLAVCPSSILGGRHRFVAGFPGISGDFEGRSRPPRPSS